jgi:hypothetical protein
VGTLSGNLTLVNSISTDNTTDSAIKLYADQGEAAGSEGQGNIIISGTPTITTTGTASLYSGKPSLSTGLVELVGESNIKTNVDATSTFDPALSSGVYALFRVGGPPTDIDLSALNVDENVSSGTTVGSLSSTDPDSGDTFTYTLVSGSGDTDNASFAISGADLNTNTTLDYETKNSYSIRVRTTDNSGSTYEKSFTITVNDLNEPPTDIDLSALNVDENVSSGTTVGSLSSTDPDSGDTFTYTLVSGSGDTDNASFAISGADLNTNTTLDYETKNSYSIRVRTTDNSGSTYEKSFTITVNDLNETPY